VAGGGSWPVQKPISITEAMNRVLNELRRLGVMEGDAIISSNLQLRLDGLPRGEQRAPADPGVAVYWVRPGEQGMKCMAIDRYNKVEHNLAAIAATLEAIRAIERHGGAEILDRAFTGFAALPAPMAASRPWRDVLGVASDERDVGRVTECYRISRSKAHPDKGGTPEAFQAVDRAYEAAQRELGFTA
jgi:hypothetical protein